MSLPLSWLNDITVPQNLHPFYERLDQAIDQDLKTQWQQALSQPSFSAQCHKVLQGSVYVQNKVLSHPQLPLHLLASNALSQTYTLEDFQAFIQPATALKEDDFNRHLRAKRTEAMVRIIWRDFNRLADTVTTMAELSALAQCCIQQALDYHYAKCCEKLGTPYSSSGEEQPLLILGMGKLGAYELNLSSDVDLIFAYPENGHTDHPRNPIDNQTFFSRLGKAIIKSLDANMGGDFVFRVDMRLRPYGQSGALVSNFASLEDYYQSQGREWERYAMVKARVVASSAPPERSAPYIDELTGLLKQFTYRKYIDFSVIEALRDLKAMIQQEVKRRSLGDDVKLGAGGIREIEFIAQVFQLIRGGREVELQNNQLLTILPTLASLQLLPQATTDALTEAYYFLRNTEHALQGYNDQQTQKLPFDPEQQQTVAFVMGFEHWQAFYQQLGEHRQAVEQAFTSIIASPTEQQDQEQDEDIWRPVWQDTLEPSESITLLEKSGYEDGQKSIAVLEELKASGVLLKMDASSRQRLDKFMPLLLQQLSDTETPDQTLCRIATLVKAVARRSAYLLLLIENPNALTQLVKLTLASPWIADRLAEHPALLDELLDQRSLYQLPSKAELADELRRALIRINEEDLEEQMEALRYFRSAHGLRVAACEVSDALPLMKVSDYLTWMAEAILEYTLQLCWQQLVAKHGYPDGEERDTPAFIIVAYGKLGGIELGHGSDLDLVFIHNAKTNGYTNGKRSLDNQTFFARLGQKIIHVLNTTTLSGQLYEVDMRLRPSGNSGLLVSTLTGFAKYQKETAWTWEHQALIRARVVAGDAELKGAFEQVRQEILCLKREPDKLKQDVIDMRLKMRQHLGSDKNNDGNKAFHLKHDAGGIVDIEFMVQYGVLAWAHADPELVRYTDNIRILESFASSNLLDTQEVDQLIAAYKAYRAEGHRLTLQQQANLLDAKQLVPERQTVTRIWQQLLECP